MAILINERTGVHAILQPQHIFGRHPTASTKLSNPEASRTHAVVIWDGECWVFQDTSSNGSYINGQYQYKGSKTHLEKGDRVQFGSKHSDEWYVKEVLPPQSLLLPITPGLPTIHLKNITVLPSEDNPEVSIFQSADGSWVCESSAGEYELKMGDRVGSEDSQWKFIDAKACMKTDIISPSDTYRPTNVSFFFNVSQNEEHVSLSFTQGESVIDLGVRSHHYLLLLLARKYLSDKEAGVEKRECGWLDKDNLCKMIGQNENHINIQIYRFRRQFLKAYIAPMKIPQVVERRTGEIRFCIADVKIQGGFKLSSHVSYDNLTTLN
ncbi:FHA domain-containing protein [Pseudomonas sp. HK3]|jgi:hypothetical protein